MNLRNLAVLLFLGLSACSGSGGSVSGLPNTAAPASDQNNVAPAALEVQSDTLRQPLSTPVPASSDLLYVSNQGNASITVYRHDAQGNAAPLYLIAGSKTGIVSPGQLSEDAQGNLYVANGPWVARGNVLVFAHGAKGNVAPIRILAGPATKISWGVYGLTVDQGTGKLFIITQIPKTQAFNPNELLLRFPPNATGNTAPFASESAIGATDPITQLASDSTGLNLIMDNIGEVGGNAVGAGIYTVQKQFPGYAPPEPEAAGVWASGIADDPSTKSYVFSGGYQSCSGPNNVVVNTGIVRFAESANGSVEFLGYLPCTFTLKPAPLSVITSATNCGQLALGYLRNIYAVCGSAIKVFAHDASGNVPPLRVLSGAATKLNAPYGIYEGK